MARKLYDGERADHLLAAQVDTDTPRVVRYEDWQDVPPRGRYAVSRRPPQRPIKPRPSVGEQVGGFIYGIVWIAVVVALVFVLALAGARFFFGVDLLGMISDYRDWQLEAQATATAQALRTPAPTSAPGTGGSGDTAATPDTPDAPPAATIAPVPTDVSPPAPTAVPAAPVAPQAAPQAPAPVAPPAPTEAPPAAPTEAPTPAPMATAAPPTAVPLPSATPEPERACINGHVHLLFWNGLDLEDEGTACGTW